MQHLVLLRKDFCQESQGGFAELLAQRHKTDTAFVW